MGGNYYFIDVCANRTYVYYLFSLWAPEDEVYFQMFCKLKELCKNQKLKKSAWLKYSFLQKPVAQKCNASIKNMRYIEYDLKHC